MCTPDATSVPECVEAIVGNRKVSVHKATGRLRVSINGETVMIHRLVMETVLGRKLLPTEHVHHKDGNPLHNAPENLEILSHAEHNALHGRLREDRITATCQHCGQEFTRYRSYGQHMFCSAECRYAAGILTHTCAQCGVQFRARRSQGQRRFCSVACSAKSRRTRSKWFTSQQLTTSQH